MRDRRLLAAPGALVALAACYHPDVPVGLPCSPELQCPAGQHCQADAPGGPRCEGMLDNMLPDSSDLPGPVNDRPDGAIDVSAGGMFAVDLSNAHADTASSCAPGRPEVFYRLTLTAPEVIYLDTFGSTFDTAIAIRDGACPSGGAEVGCAVDSCGTTQSQGAWNLAAGEHCILVVGPAGGAGPGGKLAVIRGGHTGDPLGAPSGTVTGDTCQDDNDNAARCGCEPGNDHHYFFTVCPATNVSTHLDTCGGATWDTVLQLRSVTDVSLFCNDDACNNTTSSSLTHTVTGPGLFWAIIDGCTQPPAPAQCGPYTMNYSLTPMP